MHFDLARRSIDAGDLKHLEVALLGARFERDLAECRQTQPHEDGAPYAVAVEAKADEPFSETVSDTLAAALERYLENDRSNGVAVQGLAQALLGPRKPGEPPITGASADNSLRSAGEASLIGGRE
jgi:hypothetical protein